MLVTVFLSFWCLNAILAWCVHFMLVVLSLPLLQIVRHIGIIEHVVSHFLLSFAGIVSSNSSSSSSWWWWWCCCFYFRTWKCSSRHVRDFEAHSVCALQCRCGRVRLFQCSVCVWMWIFANTNTPKRSDIFYVITRIVSTVSDLQVFVYVLGRCPHTESRLFCALTLHSTIVDNNGIDGINGIDDSNNSVCRLCSFVSFIT